MRHTVKLFGIPVYSSEVTYDPSELYLPNTGGQFELYEADDEYGEGEDEQSFGFQAST